MDRTSEAYTLRLCRLGVILLVGLWWTARLPAAAGRQDICSQYGVGVECSTSGACYEYCAVCGEGAGPDDCEGQNICDGTRPGKAVGQGDCESPCGDWAVVCHCGEPQ
jgi:hypothetical protein